MQRLLGTFIDFQRLFSSYVFVSQLLSINFNKYFMYVSFVLINCGLVAHCLFSRCAAEHSRRHGLWSADDFDSVYHTAVDRHAALAHAFYPASTTEFHLPRSAVDPPERLVAMIFPFIDDMSRGQVNEVTTTSTMLNFILFYVDNILIFFATL